MKHEQCLSLGSATGGKAHSLALHLLGAIGLTRKGLRVSDYKTKRTARSCKLHVFIDANCIVTQVRARITLGTLRRLPYFRSDNALVRDVCALIPFATKF